MAKNKSFAFLFWKTFKIFLKNNCQKVCTFKKNVVPLHSLYNHRCLNGLLSEVYRSLIGLLSESYRTFIGVLSDFYRSLIGISSTHLKRFIIFYILYYGNIHY